VGVYIGGQGRGEASYAATSRVVTEEVAMMCLTRPERAGKVSLRKESSREV
jgi:hypothetical protein